QIAPNKAVFNFISNVILMNSVHLVCPFVVLAFWPHGREYVKRKTANKKFVAMSLLGVLFCIFLAVITSKADISPSDIVNSFLGKFIFWFWVFTPNFHGLRQSLGMSVI